MSDTDKRELSDAPPDAGSDDREAFDELLASAESISAQVREIFADDQRKLAHLPKRRPAAHSQPRRRKKIPPDRDHFET